VTVSRMAFSSEVYDEGIEGDGIWRKGLEEDGQARLDVTSVIVRRLSGKVQTKMLLARALSKASLYSQGRLA
jgi:hypothetical protein